MKKIIITGCSKGLGLNLSKALSNNNIVFGLSRSNPNCKDLGENFRFIKTDIRSEQSLKKSFACIGNADILINCAGIFKSCKLEDMDTNDIIDIINTNTLGTILSAKKFLSISNKNNSKIINISSVSGKYGIENQAVYSASKHAIQGFSDSLTKELSEIDINVTTICPGGIKTTLWNNKNPYNGDFESLLDSDDIINIVKFIIDTPNNVVLKNIIMFPKSEVH